MKECKNAISPQKNYLGFLFRIYVLTATKKPKKNKSKRGTFADYVIPLTLAVAAEVTK